MAKMLKFGGPNLPPGSHTWYERRRDADAAGGTGVVTVLVYPGDLVLADVVVRDTGLTDAKGRPLTEPFADYYVKNGRASYIEVSEAGVIARRVYGSGTTKKK